jgi:hypothetical protein
MGVSRVRVKKKPHRVALALLSVKKEGGLPGTGEALRIEQAETNGKLGTLVEILSKSK